MIRYILVVFLVFTSLFQALAQEPEWNNPLVNSINEAQPHAYFMHFPDLKSALTCDRNKSTWYLSLNTNWQYKLSASPSEKQPEFQLPGYNISKWEMIKVPSIIKYEGKPKSEFPNAPTTSNPVASYRKTFPVPEEWYGQQAVLRFDGVASAFYVWMNGKRVGYSESGHYGAEFNVTPFLKFGRMNTVAVEVYRWSDCNWIEPLDTLFGIFGNVGLYSFPNVSIYDYYIQATSIVNTTDGQFKLGVFLKRFLPDIQEKFKVQVSIHDNSNKEVFPAIIKNYNPTKLADSILIFEYKLSNVKLWDNETPNLYTLILSVKNKDNLIVEAVSQKFGFHALESKDGKIMINGKSCDSVVSLNCQANQTNLTVKGKSFEKYYYCTVLQLNNQINTFPLKPAMINEIEFRVKKQILRYRNNTNIIYWETDNNSGSPLSEGIKTWIKLYDMSRPIK
jgi:beta-galactosidase